MLLTDKFVYVHLPKTGGTFVREVLTRIHTARGEKVIDYYSLRTQRPYLGTLRDWLKRPNKGFIRYYAPNQHAGCAMIPPSHQGKPILSTVRNPYDHYVSEYEFKAWAVDHTLGNPDVIRQTYPHYPDLSFSEFVYTFNKSHKLAPQTNRFIRMFYRNGSEITAQLNRELAQQPPASQFHERMYPIHFIARENLNQELYTYLLEMAYAESEIHFILEEQKIYPGGGGRSSEQAWEKYYTPELKAYVRQTEYFLFQLFPHYDL
jgi:Sulfotransferase family